MKRGLLFVAAACALLACSREEVETDLSGQPVTKAVRYTLTPIEQVEYAPGGSSRTYSITTDPNVHWHVEINVPWLHVTPKYGYGSGSFTCTADSCNTALPGRTGMIAVQFYDGQANDTAHRSFFQTCQYCVQPDNYLTEHVVNGEFYVTSQYPVRSDLRIKVYHFVWYDSFNFTEVTMSEGSSRSNTVTSPGSVARILTVRPYYDGAYHYRHR